MANQLLNKFIAPLQIDNSKISNTAAIAYSKINLVASIVNADVASGAAIAYSKLNLASSIVNADVASGAAIAYSKLALSASIVDADIASGAAVAYSKLNLSASIVNADIASGAAIAYSKLSLAASVKASDLNSQSATLHQALFADGSGGAAYRTLVAADVPDISSTYQVRSEKGAANGYASLDGGGKVPLSQLPSTLLEFKGNWDPNTNTPSLVDGTGVSGYTYWVSAADSSPVSGLTDASMTNFQIGDLVIYNGTKWVLSSPANGVTSVNGAQGAVTVNAINQLTGEATAGPASGSQSVPVTLSNAAVIGKVLTGYVSGAGVISASDSILSAIEKLNGNQGNYLKLDGSSVMSGNLQMGANKITNLANGVNPGDAVNYAQLAGVAGGALTLTQNHIFVGNASNISTDVPMSGEASIVASGAVTLSNAAVIGKVLTGYVSGAGVVAATDSILQAIQKLNGNDGNFATKALDNLASVAINASLIANADASLDLGSSSLQWNNLFVKAKIESNAAAGGIGTGFFIQTKNVTGAVNSANLQMVAGTVDTAGQTSGSAGVRSADLSAAGTSSGNAFLRSGDITAASGAGVSGQLLLRSGNSTAGATGVTGLVSIASGNGAANNSGSMTVKSGNVSTAASGGASYGSGNATSGSGSSGLVDVSSGTTVDGTSGAAQLRSGIPSGTGVRGNVQLFGSSVIIGGGQNGGSLYTGLNILPSTGASTVSGQPPISDNTKNIGASSNRFANIHVVNVNADASQLVLNGNGISASSQLISNVSDPVSAQDAMTLNYAGAHYLALAGGTMSGAIAMGSNKITGLANGTASGDAVNYSQLGNWNQYAYTLTSTDITNQYVDLAHKVVHNSLVSAMDRQALMGAGVDFSLSEPGAVSRFSFAGDIATGGAIAAAAGDIMYFTYLIA